MTVAAPSVVVFGSLHYDIIVKGPHRPRKGETVTGSAWYPKCGGKGGNQAVSAAKYGVKSAMIGAVAEDSFGHALKVNLDAHGVDIRSVRTVSGEGSGMSVAIFDADGDYGAVIVSGSNLALSEEDVSTAAELFRSDAVLVLQNEVPDAANVLAAQAMKKAGGRVVLNAAPARLPSADLVALVDVVVVNAVEAEALAEVPEVNSLDRLWSPPAFWAAIIPRPLLPRAVMVWLLSRMAAMRPRSLRSRSNSSVPTAPATSSSARLQQNWRGARRWSGR